MGATTILDKLPHRHEPTDPPSTAWYSLHDILDVYERQVDHELSRINAWNKAAGR